MKYGLQFIWVAVLAVVAASAQAEATDAPAVAAESKKGSYVIVMRHGATARDQADTDPLNPDNSKVPLAQRERAGAGEAGRRSIQEARHSARNCLQSKFNRAVETGNSIGGGAVTPTIDVTEGGLVVTPIENDRRTEALKRMIATGPPAGKNTSSSPTSRISWTRLARTGSTSRKAKRRSSASMRPANHS